MLHWTDLVVWEWCRDSATRQTYWDRATLGDVVNGDGGIETSDALDEAFFDEAESPALVLPEGYLLSGPHEEPSWDTPREPVDWGGFAAELAAVQTRFFGIPLAVLMRCPD